MPSDDRRQGSHRQTIAAMCRDGRRALGWSQATLSRKVGVGRSTIADIERGRLDPSLDRASSIATTLGYELVVTVRTPGIIGGRRQKDIVHARCSAYAHRRFLSAGWEVAREVQFQDGQWHGWVDLLAFDPRTGTLLVIEIKSRLDDVGALERQSSWYRNVARRLARDRGWEVTRIETWVLALASAEVEGVLHANRDLFALAFPRRAADLARTLDRGDPGSTPARGIAAIDPCRRRRTWILPTKIDGRRTPAPYRGYAEAAQAFSGRVQTRPPIQR